MELNATLVVQGLIFLILLMWLSQFLFAPFLRLFEEREKSIQGARKEAEALQISVQKRLHEIEEKIKASQKQAKQLLLDLKAEGAEYQRSLLESARKEAKEKTAAAEIVLNKKIKQIKVEIENKIPELSEIVIDQFLGTKHNHGPFSPGFNKMESRGAL